MTVLAAQAVEEKQGRLAYFKDADFGGKSRIVEIDGDHMLATVTLDYHSKPSGVADGDGGTHFYLKVKQPEKIKEGTAYELNGGIFEARVAEWASPHSYQVMSGPKGKIIVRNYAKYRKLVVDVAMRYGPDQKEYNGKIVFENHTFTRVYKGKFDWDSFDSSSTRGRAHIRISDLQGVWKAVNAFHEEQGKITTQIDTSIDMHNYLEIGAANLKRAASLKHEPFVLKEYQLHVETAQGDKRRVIGVINKITKNELVISWKETWLYEGKEFSSRHRFVYRKIPTESLPY